MAAVGLIHFPEARGKSLFAGPQVANFCNFARSRIRKIPYYIGWPEYVRAPGGKKVKTNVRTYGRPAVKTNVRTLRDLPWNRILDLRRPLSDKFRLKP